MKDINNGRRCPYPLGATLCPDGRTSASSDETFRKQGFFLVRKGGSLTALSAWCTHRRCKLDAEPDHTFYCPCHGSTFDTVGHVTEGPARRDLPVFAVRTEGGRVLVTLPG